MSNSQPLLLYKIKPVVRKATHFRADRVVYVKEICNYIYDTYGRFPAHVGAFYTPGMFLQFSHLEMEYYDRFFDPAQYTKQREHGTLWDGEAPGAG